MKKSHNQRKTTRTIAKYIIDPELPQLLINYLLYCSVCLFFYGSNSTQGLESLD
jgi:hypothetical protein